MSTDRTPQSQQSNRQCIHRPPCACDTAKAQLAPPPDLVCAPTLQVTLGDRVFVAPAGGAGALVAAAVSSITTTVEAGLYSPWTLEGSIIVDDVAASTHTAWWVA